MKEDKEDKSLKKSKDQLEKRIEELESRIESLDNSWKRALADYKNLEKRTSEEKEGFLSFVKIQVLEKFLPFFDNLEKIERHLEDEGLNITLKDLKRTLKDMGVEEVEALGKDFDLNLMEAVEIQKGEKNKVLKVHQKGYLLNGVLLRPAKVAVGQD